jgi:replicative DNA helicase
MTTDTVTPHSLEAEMAVLGAILVHGERFLDVGDVLPSADFFRQPHSRIYTVMRELAAAGVTIDTVTVAERLKQQGRLDEIGGHAYLARLMDAPAYSSNIEAYVKIVKDHAAKRRLRAALQKSLADIDEHADEDARTLIDSAERLIFTVSQQDTRGDFVPAPALVAEGMPRIAALAEHKRGVTGVPTGFIDFDEMTRGFQPASLVILAARPSMGKTAFALNAAHHAASHGRQVGLFSIEQCKDELFMRLVSSVGKIDGHRLQCGYLNDSDYGRLGEAFSEIGSSGLHVDDSPVLGILDVRGKARRLKARHGLDLLIVDYLQLMQTGKAENRNLAIADISRSLKMVARELEIPVVVLSQLSRELEKRGDKRPMLSDLRDSGALEQDADLVVFVHRPEVYQETADNAGLAEIIIAKQRNGRTGTIKLRWSKGTTRFDNWSDRR